MLGTVPGVARSRRSRRRDGERGGATLPPAERSRRDSWLGDHGLGVEVGNGFSLATQRERGMRQTRVQGIRISHARGLKFPVHQFLTR